MSSSSATDQVKGAFMNTVNPWNITRKDGGNLILGNVQVIALEVLTSKLVRWALGMRRKSIIDLALIHTISQSFLGGLAGAFPTTKSLTGKHGPLDSLSDGAKQIPGVLAAQYIYHTANVGLNLDFKKISFADLLVTAASKTLTRPLINLIYTVSPAAVAKGFDAHDVMLESQHRSSRLNR